MSSSGKYIVVFKPTATKDEIEQYANNVIKSGGDVTHRYDVVLNGFSAVIPDHFMTSLRASDIIDYIEPDGVMTIQ